MTLVVTSDQVENALAAIAAAGTGDRVVVLDSCVIRPEPDFSALEKLAEKVFRQDWPKTHGKSPFRPSEKRPKRAR